MIFPFQTHLWRAPDPLNPNLPSNQWYSVFRTLTFHSVPICTIINEFIKFLKSILILIIKILFKINFDIIKFNKQFFCRCIRRLFFGTWKKRTEPTKRQFGGHSKLKIVTILWKEMAAQIRLTQNYIHMPKNPRNWKTLLQSSFRFAYCLSSWFLTWFQLDVLVWVQSS